jgi:hypothetical protein
MSTCDIEEIWDVDTRSDGSLPWPTPGLRFHLHLPFALNRRRAKPPATPARSPIPRPRPDSSCLDARQAAASPRPCEDGVRGRPPHSRGGGGGPLLAARTAASPRCLPARAGAAASLLAQRQRHNASLLTLAPATAASLLAGETGRRRREVAGRGDGMPSGPSPRVPRRAAAAPLPCRSHRRRRGAPGAQRPAAGHRACLRAARGERPPSAWRGPRGGWRLEHQHVEVASAGSVSRDGGEWDKRLLYPLEAHP